MIILEIKFALLICFKYKLYMIIKNYYVYVSKFDIINYYNFIYNFYFIINNV